MRVYYSIEMSEGAAEDHIDLNEFDFGTTTLEDIKSKVFEVANEKIKGMPTMHGVDYDINIDGIHFNE